MSTHVPFPKSTALADYTHMLARARWTRSSSTTTFRAAQTHGRPDPQSRTWRGGSSRRSSPRERFGSLSLPRRLFKLYDACTMRRRASSRTAAERDFARQQVGAAVMIRVAPRRWTISSRTAGLGGASGRARGRPVNASARWRPLQAARHARTFVGAASLSLAVAAGGGDVCVRASIPTRSVARARSRRTMESRRARVDSRGSSPRKSTEARGRGESGASSSRRGARLAQDSSARRPRFRVRRGNVPRRSCEDKRAQEEPSRSERRGAGGERPARRDANSVVRFCRDVECSSFSAGSPPSDASGGRPPLLTGR